jgi:putative transposase
VFAPVVEYYKETGAGRRTTLVSETLGYSRQQYYKSIKEKKEYCDKENKVVDMVKERRKRLPHVGTRKLHHMIKEELGAESIRCGRDKLFEIMKKNGLGIKSKKRYIQTTNSKHWLRKYPNILKTEDVKQPEDAWVSDITYIKTEEGNCYLNLITDVYSRKIVGYSILDSMETRAMIKAYKMAIDNKIDKTKRTIHHSDRGIQYCSKEYIRMSSENNCRISMTENGDPYENALAERMNRTLKEEFGLGEVIKTKELAYRLVEEAVDLYNNYRPHLSLSMKTPNEIHRIRLPIT